MWNSPHRKTRRGKRYDLADIAALTYPLGQMLDFLDSSPVEDVVDEPILQRMDKDELTFAPYEVLFALLEDVPVTREGHTGYQEAVVAELLHQTAVQIGCELDDPEFGDSARRAAWRSLNRLLLDDEAKNGKGLWQLEDLRLNYSNPRVYRSKKITSDLWDDLLLGEGGLWDEFLWDDDWRMESLLDLPPSAAKSVTDMAGINLDVVHRLPHTPTKAERNMAEFYIRYIIWKEEALGD